ncbi:cell division protein FtsZ [Candidatus Fermentibacteria bacterium]|nr:cell division protein FtsZ [Candidatus Fermentibacteria bacterium]
MVVTQLTEVGLGEDATGRVRLRVVGVGGCGCNAIDRMIRKGISGVEFIAMNTDAQVLDNCLADVKLQIGQRATRGHGAGGNCEIGEQAAEESMKEIEELLDGSHMVFLTAGMGGGTGTGATPHIAKAAREAGAVTVGIVTSPFEYEGPIRNTQAEHGIELLRKEVDTLIVIPNDRLRTLAEEDSTLTQMFDMANDVLLNAVDGICSLISSSGLINRDFQDVKTVITQGGGAMIGTGKASGQNRAAEAAKDAISGPLLDSISIEGAKALLIHIQSSPDVRFNEFDEAVRTITQAAGNQAHVFLGTSLHKELGDEMKITVIATGFGQPVNTEPEEMPFPSAKAGAPFPFNGRTGRENQPDPFHPVGSGSEINRMGSNQVPPFLRNLID